MKLNDFKLVENAIKEADSSYFIGDLGKAMAQQANARFNPFSKGGNPELSVQDKMTSNIYVKDFVGRAKEALKRGIDGKQIDPNPNAGSTPVQGTTPPSPVDNKQTAPTELTPAQIRQQKQMSAAKTAQDQMAKNPVPTKTTQTTQPPQPTPGDIRQQKQTVATKNAQSQMVPFSKLPGDQFAKSASNVRQQKQAQATAALQKQMTPKQATAPAVWKNNRNPNAPAATSPQAAAQPAQQKPAVWKNNRTGKVGTSPIMRESIFEAGQYPDTISSFINKFFKKYNTGLALSPEIMKQVDAIAKQIQANYSKTGAQAELDQLAKLGYSINQSELANQPQPDKEVEKDKEQSTDVTQPQGPLSYDRQSGDLLGHDSSSKTTADQLNKVSTPTPSDTTPSDEKSGTTTTTSTTTPVKPETAYNQAKKLLGKLNKQQKRYVLNALKKELGMAVDKKQASPEPVAEPSAMSNMARQLSAMGQKQTSTGGTQVPTGTGVRHTAGKGQKIKQAKALKAKTATPKTKKAKAVAENKTYKIWGAK